MKKILTCFLLLSISIISSHEVTEDEGVLVLNEFNFDQELQKHKYMLVEFYAPWCHHCQSLQPEYSRAAQRLRENNPPYYIAKVDGTESQPILWRYGIDSYPTIMFFKDGQQQEIYWGDRSEWSIVNYFYSKIESEPASHEINCDDLKSKLEDANRKVLAYFGDGSDSKFGVFINAAQQSQGLDRIEFYHVVQEGRECSSKFNSVVDPALIMFGPFDHSPVHYKSSWEQDLIRYWMQAAQQPAVIEFSDDYVDYIFSSQRQAIILFRNNRDIYKDYHKVYNEVASKYRSSIIKFVVSDVKEGVQAHLASFLGIKDHQLPSLIILNTADSSKKYKYDGDVNQLTEESLKQFINEYFHGNLKQWSKGEEITTDTKNPQKKLVPQNFNAIVIDNEDEVFVNFHTQWCEHCRNLQPQWQQLATYLEDVPHLTIAEFDFQNNDFDGMDIWEFPTLLFYPKDGKSEPLRYEGELSLEEFLQWLTEKSHYYHGYLESQTEL